ncbi:MAG: ferrous iron transport protein A [Candidatus Heimdallarchaeota archaeon]|nr:ferrous iron transport protein A [Candidatus Heimdallarchaeota archaeon]
MSTEVWSEPRTLTKHTELPLVLHHLEECDGHTSHKLIQIEDESVRIRLSEMGFVPGSMIKVIRNNRRGPLLIETKGIRVMICRKIAREIMVE